MKKVNCDHCDKELCNDEIALNLKLLGKQIGNFKCYQCLSQYFSFDTEKLISLAEYYKNSGCFLFQISYIC